MITETGYEYFENSKGNQWVRYFYDITVFHESGESLPPVKRCVAVAMVGAQTSGTAQSYVLKQFFRGLFIISTGDNDDADLMPSDDTLKQPQTVSSEQFTQLRDKVEEWGGDQAKFIGAYGAQSLEQFPVAALQKALAALDKRIAEKPHVEEDEIPY